MKITTIQISGFRKILKATINMEDDITVIAGANNRVALLMTMTIN